MSTVLIVEDEAPLLEELIEWLTLEGYDAMGAANGKEGLELAIKQQPDVILSDVMMPVMNGHELLKELKAREDTALIPFIFLTARADRPDARMGMGMGADDYVTKPCTRDELLGTVQARIRNREKIQTQTAGALNDLRSTLVHILPHEFRTPLTHIIGYAEALEMDADVMSTQEVRDMAEHIAAGGRRLLRISENYLLYAQLEIIGMDADRIQKVRDSESGAGSDTILAACQEVATRHERTDDLRIDVQDADVLIAADSLRKVIYELVDNAFKFSKAGQPVDVTGKINDGWYDIVIADQGAGIPASFQKEIGAYMQFQRKLREQQGLGFGLVLAKRLVELFDGGLFIQSEPAGGTSIGVRLHLVRQSVRV
ncbi:MAG: response regulator [Anaerolineae bacterium]